MSESTLSDSGRLLCESLADISPTKSAATDTFHVDGMGGRLSFAYEQLRNAAEYTEQHLLLRRSIERFLQRNLNFKRPEPVVAELVIELTQARYLPNDSVPQSTITELDEVLGQFVELYRQIKASHRLAAAQVQRWVLQVASVHLEQTLVPQPSLQPFADFMYDHYLQAVEESELAEQLGLKSYRIALYTAAHRTILKSDMATIRAFVLSSQIIEVGDQDPATYFVHINQLVDKLYQDKNTNRLQRLINQHGAPMRILHHLVLDIDQPTKLLSNRQALLGRVRQVTKEQYARVRTRLNQGIVRSVAFVAITKILIGVVLEIPYDLVRHGHIVWGPLIINILFPPIYMATLGLSVRPPSRKNAELITKAVDQIMYESDHPVRYRLRRRVSSPALNRLFNALYAITFVVIMGTLGWILYKLHFNLMSGVIFFIFLSTVSFLGFRLTQTAREYEMVEARRGLVGLVADLFYTPFIRIGQWLSDKYAQVNVVARVLDLLIELPLKTVLRFMRQWVGFLRDKQEEL
jgi:hypothetical protein